MDSVTAESKSVNLGMASVLSFMYALPVSDPAMQLTNGFHPCSVIGSYFMLPVLALVSD